MKGNCPLTLKLGLDTLFTLVTLFGLKGGFAEFVKLDQGDKGFDFTYQVKFVIISQYLRTSQLIYPTFLQLIQSCHQCQLGIKVFTAAKSVTCSEVRPHDDLLN